MHLVCLETLHRTFGKLIMSVTYGIDVRSSEDVYITNAQNALSSLNATGNVGTYLVDFIPLRELSSSLCTSNGSTGRH